MSNVEGFLAYLRALRMASSDIPIEPWRQEIKPGDFVLSDRLDDFGVLIYGEVLDMRHPEDPPCSPLYLEGRWYSARCPEGELGRVHRAMVSIKLNRHIWEVCKEQGWPNDPKSLALVVLEAQRRSIRSN